MIIARTLRKGELDAIVRDLDRQITELNNVEIGLRRDFQGIGTDICANRLLKVNERLRQAIRMLRNLDTNRLAPGFELPGNT
jgi:hypothetical protein